jgi:menaquinone-dependent protoporphyrinogen oxidase
MKKSLLIYSTVDGQTEAICRRMASCAKNTSVDVMSISNVRNLDDYKTIIIGASIRYGKYRNEVYNFINENSLLLESKKNAFFSVNVVARKPEKNTPDTNPYVIKFLEKINWKPKNIEVFAGKIDYPKYKFIDKYAIKFIMWITKGPTDTSQSYEFTDWNKVETFAENLNL